MDYRQQLQQHFGFGEFRQGQEEVISALDTYKAALAVFPTGGGKSLCYQLPALGYEGLTLVVSPLIALMKDQIDFLQARGIAAERLDSSLSLDDTRRVSDQMQSGELKLLYVAPERFNNERFLAQLARTKIALFAVDEAHCISEWGHNFRPDYLKLADTAFAVNAERVLALTATATPSVVDDICKAFRIPKEASIVTGFYRHNLQMEITPVLGDARDDVLRDRIAARPSGPTIVYVTLQKTAERVAAFLEHAGMPAKAYHAGLESEARHSVQEWWKASDSNIVVATIAFGMGIDKNNVRYVYHYNLPKSLESYSQEIGRAGRDEMPSVVEMLACADDVPVLENFAYGDTPAENALRGLVDELLSKGPEFDVSLYDLSSRHDLRQLVLRTALTYLELLGVLRQGTPFYAGYDFRPLVPLPQIYATFPGEHGQFVADVIGAAKKRSTWYGIDPDVAADKLGKERRRVVRCLEVLEERGLIELTAADARQRYSRLRDREDAEALADDLSQRFLRRESQEIMRVGQVLALVTRDGCQTNGLVAYFGENRAQPCGHCTHCRTGQALTLPPSRVTDVVPVDFDTASLQNLRSSHPAALGQPRQAARFLCGLPSPAIAKARLGKNPFFGALEELGFQTVLTWVADK